MNKFKVHKNILPEEQWKHLHDYIGSAWFSWTYAAGTSHDGDGYKTVGDTPQLVRNFFHREQNTDTFKTPNPFNESIHTHKYLQSLPEIMEIVHKLLPNCTPWRIKANLLQPYPDSPEHHPWHTDALNNNISMIYYLNDSDGDTFLGETNTQRVTPKANTAVIFPSNLRHASSNPTKGRRMIINYMVQNGQ